MATTIRGLSVCVVASALLVLEPRPLCLGQESQPAAAPEAVPAPAQAEPVPQPAYPGGYGAVEAGQESYQRAEAQRQAAVRRQAGLNVQMRWYSGPPGYYAYAPGVAAFYAGPPALAWGPRRAARYAAARWGFPGYFPYPPPALRAYRGALEPWPMPPGGVYGYPYPGLVPPWRGRVEVRIGPGVILSRPGSGPADQAPQGPTPAPPQTGPEPVPAPTPAPPAPAVPELNPPASPAPALPPAS